MKKIQKSLGRRHKVLLKTHSKNFLEVALIAAIIEKLNNNWVKTVSTVDNKIDVLSYYECEINMDLEWKRNFTLI